MTLELALYNIPLGLIDMKTVHHKLNQVQIHFARHACRFLLCMPVVAKSRCVCLWWQSKEDACPDTKVCG